LPGFAAWSVLTGTRDALQKIKEKRIYLLPFLSDVGRHPTRNTSAALQTLLSASVKFGQVEKTVQNSNQIETKADAAAAALKARQKHFL
jgi:hypothetical protein